MRIHLPGLNKAEKNGFLTFKGSPHFSSYTHSAASLPTKETPILSRTWGQWGKLPLQPADPFSQRSLPLFQLFSSSATLAKEGIKNTRAHIHSFIMPCHKYLWSLCRSQGYRGLGSRTHKLAWGLSLGTNSLGWNLVPAPDYRRTRDMGSSTHPLPSSSHTPSLSTCSLTVGESRTPCP